MTNTIPTAEKAHPFELAGMGCGPYRFLRTYSIPSAFLAEHNPTGYQAALQEMPKGLANGCGTCGHCGRPIRLVCIVKDANGAEWGVGSSCIEKTGDKALGDPAKVAVAKATKAARLAKAQDLKEAKRKLWLAMIDPITGETNGARLERENREREAIAAERKALREAEGARWDWLCVVIETTGDWGKRCAATIRAGDVPRRDTRFLDVLGDIFARQAGRRGSAAYQAALNTFSIKADELLAP
jgi:hypothetical protein